jgi:hypothetical protein
VYNNGMKPKLQAFFDWVSQELYTLETRWLVLIVTVLIMLALRAVGAAGAADLTAMIYIMYFVTFWRTHDR